MEHKSNKELAVDVAIAYIKATSQQVFANGASKDLISLSSVCNVIKSTYQTLESLESDK